MALLLALVAVAAPATGRQRQRIDGDWRFCLGAKGVTHTGAEASDDASWRTVQLPHDYVVEGGFERNGDGSHGFRPKPIGWYQRRIDIAPDPKSRYWLEFDGVFRDCTIWLNGKPVGGHKSGYTSFYFDVTPYLDPSGHDLIAVRVDPSKDEGWWYEGGGIYRHVWLTKVPLVHVGHWGTFVTTPVVEASQSEFHADVEVENEGDRARDVTVESTIVWGDEAVTTLESSVHLAVGKTIVPQRTNLYYPHLWSPDSPALYRLFTTIKIDGVEIDQYETPFGVRSVKFDPDKGFLLNGKPLKLKGTANHQDFAAVGVALTDNLQRLRIKQLQSMGCNAYRSAHNPPTPEMLDACDELGMLVLDETRHPGDTFSGKSERNTPTDDMSEVDAMVVRDRNHPCVIAWSLCNEEWALQTNADGVRILGAVNKRVKELDTSRPTTLAMGGGAWDGNSPNLRDVVDVIGANYGPEAYDDFHHRFPTNRMMATEFSAKQTTRGIYENDPARGYVTSMPELLTGSFAWMKPQDVSWAAIASRPFVAGGFIWTGFDYRGEPTPYQWPYDWPDVIGAWGQMDLCGFPKDAYYYFQAAWGPSDRPIVHLFPDWNLSVPEGQPVKVCAYTNAQEIELFLNGKPVGGRVTAPLNGHVEWTAPYAPGVLIAKGYRGGRSFGEGRVETTGAAAAIQLRTDDRSVMADPEDLVCVRIALRDAKGRVVPTACDALQFSVRGPASIVGAGNGDPSDHEPENTASLTATTFSYKAFNGFALVVLRPTGKSGRIVLTVSGAGLSPSSLTISARR